MATLTSVNPEDAIPPNGYPPIVLEAMREAIEFCRVNPPGKSDHFRHGWSHKGYDHRSQALGEEIESQVGFRVHPNHQLRKEASPESNSQSQLSQRASVLKPVFLGT